MCNYIRKTVLTVMLCCILICTGFILGRVCTHSILADHNLTDQSTDRMLIFSCTPSEESTTFFPCDLNYQTQWELVYRNISDVRLKVDDQEFFFVDAITNKIIDTAQLFYYARMDAKNGYCTVIPISKNGLSAFDFQYPELDLWIRYDVYETPDGSLHVIDEINLSAPGMESTNARTTYHDLKTGERLEKEDWALLFEVADVSSSGITINITQGGPAQQFGNLSTQNFIIRESDTSVIDSQWLKIDIPHNEITKVDINWSINIGKLPPGNYTLQLNISDDTSIRTSKRIHPLTQDYTTWQEYYIPFTISAP